MAQEDQTPKCSDSSGGGGGGGHIVRSSKEQNPKKVPQRGLGVAHLERIRLEEQQKKDAPSSKTKSSNHQPCPSPIFRPSSSSSSVVQNIEILNSNSSSTVPLTNPPGWEHPGNIHKLYNCCDFNLEKKCPGVDPGSAFRSNLNNFPCESIPIWSLPNLMHSAQQFQHLSSSIACESSATSSSSVLNFQMEPPSNQSYYSNYLMWPEEEKRPYPFSLDQPPGFSSLHYKIPPIVHPRIIRSSEDSASCGSGHTHFRTREGSACSTFMLEPNNSKKSIKVNGVLNGGFLTLAPPTTGLYQGSKFNHPPHFLAFNNAHEFPDFESLHYQGNDEDQIHRPGPNRRQA